MNAPICECGHPAKLDTEQRAWVCQTADCEGFAQVCREATLDEVVTATITPEDVRARIANHNVPWDEAYRQLYEMEMDALMSEAESEKEYWVTQTIMVKVSAWDEDDAREGASESTSRWLDWNLAYPASESKVEGA